MRNWEEEPWVKACARVRSNSIGEKIMAIPQRDINPVNIGPELENKYQKRMLPEAETKLYMSLDQILIFRMLDSIYNVRFGRKYIAIEGTAPSNAGVTPFHRAFVPSNLIIFTNVSFEDKSQDETY
jgi:hypothetical protein